MSLWSKVTHHKRAEMLEAGSACPPFELQIPGGGSRRSSDILAKGPVLLAFFKVSCPVCKMTFPYLERLAKGTLQVIGVSQDNSGATEAFNRNLGITFPVLLDEADKGYPASNSFGIRSVPSLFLIEPDGNIAKAVPGFSKRDIQEIADRAGVRVFDPDDKAPDWKAG